MLRKQLVHKIVLPLSLFFSTATFALDCKQSTPCTSELEKLQLIAQEGMPEAQVMMGYLFLEGISVEKDHAKAYSWFLKGTEHQRVIADAHYMVGLYNIDGQVVEKDIVKGLEYITTAAKDGLANAQARLGKLFYDGIHTPKDYNKARYWFELAAEQSNRVGAYYAAKLAAVGAGGKKSIAKAKKWYLLAAQSDYKDSRQRLAKLDSTYLPEAESPKSDTETTPLSDSQVVSLSLQQIETLMTINKSNFNHSTHMLNAMLYNGERRYDHFKNTSLDFGFSEQARLK